MRARQLLGLKGVASALLTGVLVYGCGGDAGTLTGGGDSGTPPGPGLIAFTSNQDGCPRINHINPDGSGLLRLTDCLDGEFAAAWSPDGTKIAFQSNQLGVSSGYGVYGLFTMSADGSHGQVLPPAEPTIRFTDPAWSPGGGKLAARAMFKLYSCGRISCTLRLGWRLVVMNADGSDVESVFTGPTIVPRIPGGGVPPGPGAPTWSVDGRIAFVNYGGLSVMNPDGTGLTNLTTGYGVGTPAWAPDGTKIAFVRYNPDGTGEVWVVSAAGGDVTQLTHDQVSVGRPAWSPDGTQIAFGSTKSGNWELYVMNTDGSRITPLTTGNGTDPKPAWSR